MNIETGCVFMKGFLNRRRASCALSALCFVALGAFLFFWPEMSSLWICYLLGGVLMLSGIVYICSHFLRAKGAAIVFQYDLILGVVLMLMGLWLLTTPGLIFSLIQYILGAILVIHGVIDLQGALNLRSGGAVHWWWSALLAAVTLALGAVVIWNPCATRNALLMLLGAALMFDGISDWLILLHLTHTFRKVRHAVEEAVEEAVEDAAVIESTGEVEK